MNELKTLTYELKKQAGYLNLYVAAMQEENNVTDVDRLKKELEAIRQQISTIEDELRKL